MIRILFLVVGVLLASLMAQACDAGVNTSRGARITRKSTLVGMNLANVNYWGTEIPFLDRMKTAGVWIANGATEPLRLSREGYPVAVPAGADGGVYTMVGMDPVDSGQSKDFVLLYKGGPVPLLMGGRMLSSKPGRVEFRYEGDTNMMLLALGRFDPANPPTSIKIVRKDQEMLLAAGEIFNPAFVDHISAFDTLRYLDWISTNVTRVTRWADRTTPAFRSWAGGDNNNVPIEVMVALANKTRTNMWLHAPTFADNDYVRQMMTYVRHNLNPSLSVHLEYSNEVWNWGFQQSGYAHVEAAKLWGQDVNGDGLINPTEKAEQYGPGWVTWYGYRAAQIASIANQVFGADVDRLHNVLATQTVYHGLETHILDGVGRAKLGSVDVLFDEYAVTTYFDGMLRGANEGDRATILSWAKGGDAGLAAAFAALKSGTGLTARDEGSLAWLRQTLVYQAEVARKNGLDLVAYEGGVDLTGNTGVYGADSLVVAAFLKRLQADRRMGDIYSQMVAEFSAVGGTLLNPLIDVDAGMWGHLKSIYDEGSPAWDSLVAAQEAAKARSADARCVRSGAAPFAHRGSDVGVASARQLAITRC